METCSSKLNIQRRLRKLATTLVMFYVNPFNFNRVEDMIFS